MWNENSFELKVLEKRKNFLYAYFYFCEIVFIGEKCNNACIPVQASPRYY